VNTATALPDRALRPYQLEGVRWLVHRLTHGGERCVLLCDDPGLGKSRQVLAARGEIGAKRTLIVCPAGIRHVWANEIRKWFPELSPHVVLVEPGITVTGMREQLDHPEAIVIVGYDTLSAFQGGWAANLMRRAWDLLVVDEAHYLKNPSRRTEMVYGKRGTESGLQHVCQWIILLTGTPTPNHAGELYQHLRTFWPGTLTVARPDGLAHVETEAEFQERYTEYKNTPWGRQVTGSNRVNLGQLREKMKTRVLRRRKREVLPELPPLVAQDVALDVNVQDQALIRTEAERRIQARLASVMTPQERRDLLTDPAMGISLATIRRQLGEIKINAAVAWIDERLACGVNKMLVFGWHVDVLHRLHRLLAAFDPVIITGETSPVGRRSAEHLFQNRPTVRVLVGQILACGTGITLTAASEVAILEPSWVPGQNSQAIDRAHRLGQHDSVLASFLYVPDTLDETIMRAFRRKAEEVSQIHDYTGGEARYAS